VFGITDLHEENILLMLEGPAVVDGETFVSPVPRRHAHSELNSLIDSEYFTVLRSGLLPHQSRSLRGVGIMAGLEGIPNNQNEKRLWRWKYINSDRMELSCETEIQTEAPLPSRATLFQDQLLNGFEETYRDIQATAVRY
jgi:lantibiotic modifying enzyme